MFESLSDRLGGVFDRLRGRGALTEADVRAAMREVRVALLEADVALPVAREFVETTFKWSPFWLNERELARRPWLRNQQYIQIDRLLAEEVPDYFRYRKLESEYATLFLPQSRREVESPELPPG